MNGINEHNDLTLHIVLATIPQKQEQEFKKTVIDEHFIKYRNNIQKYCNGNSNSSMFCIDDRTKSTPVLYNPLRYYILGNYDVAYISLIDNFKFAQKLFEPGNNQTKQKDIFSPHTFQSFTGINYHGTEEIKSFFHQHLIRNTKRSKYFLSICNLKLNNGFLIGNGKVYIDSVKIKIQQVVSNYNKKKSEFDQVEYLLVQSFSWFEFSLLIFTNNPDAISDILITLRGLSISSLINKKAIVEDSLYHSFYPLQKDKIIKANVFADTHTYIGLHADLIDLEESHSFVKNFLKDVEKNKIKLATEIEWQVKPGHMHLLVNVLEKSDLNTQFILLKRFLLAGKTDYLIQEKSDSVLTNFYLLRVLFNKRVKIFDHIRKIQTRVLFEGPGKRNTEEKRRVSLSLQPYLKKLGVKNKDSKLVDEQLKALKVSRQIRSKIIKIFSNYNNGIQDVILFPFFLDFKIFIDELKTMVNEEARKWAAAKKKVVKDSKEIQEFSQKRQYAVSTLEDVLMKNIDIFQEGFYVRTLNCYQYEDITDFDLDFNGSLQQLLSAYSSLISELAYMFYSKERYQYGPVVQLNLKDTVGNYNSINYYVHHLSSPEFVFATVTKEILNNVQADTEVVSRIYSSFKKLPENLSWKNRHLKGFIDGEIIRIDYSIIDAIRFIVTYDFDFKLFYYWFWTHNLQNPLLFDKSGLMNEIHFQKELFRILFVVKYFKIDISKVYCPLPELYTFWERHFKKMVEITDIFIEVLRAEELSDSKPSESLFSLISRYVLLSANKYYEKAVPEEYAKDQPLSNVASDKIRMLKDTVKGFASMPINLFAGKEILFSEFDKNSQNSKKHLDSLIYIQWYMISYLRKIMEGNNNKISFLRRDWGNGMPLRYFILCAKEQSLYKVDQTGGLFFDNMDNLHKYLKMSSVTLLDLIHLSMISKKKFILKKLNK